MLVVNMEDPVMLTGSWKVCDRKHSIRHFFRMPSWARSWRIRWSYPEVERSVTGSTSFAILFILFRMPSWARTWRIRWSCPEVERSKICDRKHIIRHFVLFFLGCHHGRDHGGSGDPARKWKDLRPEAHHSPFCFILFRMPSWARSWRILLCLPEVERSATGSTPFSREVERSATGSLSFAILLFSLGCHHGRDHGGSGDPARKWKGLRPEAHYSSPALHAQWSFQQTAPHRCSKYLY